MSIRWIGNLAYVGETLVGRIWRSDEDGRWDADLLTHHPEGGLEEVWPMGDYITRHQAVKAVEGGHKRRERHAREDRDE